MKTILRKIEFEVILFFFKHWHKIIPRNIDYCNNGSFFVLLQNTTDLFLRISQYWPRELSNDFTRRRIRHLIEKSLSVHPIFMGKIGFKKGSHMKEFNLFPILTRSVLRMNFSKAIDEYDARIGKEKLLIARTSGSTGIPLRVGVTDKFIVHYGIVRRRLFEFAGLGSKDEYIYPRTVLNIFFCKKNQFLTHDLKTLISSYQDLFRVIRKRNIVGIYAFPTVLMLLKERIERDRIAPPKLKALITCGESLSSTMRQSLEDIFGAKVFNQYDSIELEALSQECEYQDGFHINQEFYFVEILSSENKPINNDIWGRVIVTPLDLFLIPIFRYDTGDIGMILSAPCPCGRTLPRLKIQGRTPDVIHTPKGVISPFAFKEILDWYDPKFKKIMQYQLILENKNRLSLLIVPTESFQDKDLQDIKKVCRKFLQDMIDFDISISRSVEYVGTKTPFFLRRESAF